MRFSTFAALFTLHVNPLAGQASWYGAATARVCAEGIRELSSAAVRESRAAPETIVVNATRLVLKVSAFMNLQPGMILRPGDTLPARCKDIAPLDLHFVLTSADSSDLPPHISLDSAWVVGQGHAFAAIVATWGASTSDSARRLARHIWGSPWWVTKEPISLVAQVRTGDGHRYLLRSPVFKVEIVE